MSASSSNDALSFAAFKNRVQDIVESFRSSTRFFKWKTGVIAAWVLLSIASITLALSGGESNPIDAVVNVRPVLENHMIHIRNNSKEPWQDLRITLPGGWTYERRTVRPQEAVLVSVTEFQRVSDGIPESPEDFSPAEVTVSTRTGTFVWVASPGR